MDFFERQHQAKKKTKLLVFYFFIAVFLIVASLNTVAFFILNNINEFQLTPQQWFYSQWFLVVTLGTLVIIIIGSLIRGFQVKGGGKAVAEMVKARPVSMNSKDKLERRLINVVEEMSIASGMPVPTIYVMDDEQGMNAFVAGLVPSDTVLVVTEGLLEKLDRQELQGVVAHEFSHIFNADMRLNVRLITILGGILAIGQLGYFLLRTMRYSSHRRRSSSNSNNNQMAIVMSGSAIALLVIGYIGLFFGRLIKAAISRQREFLADAHAVQYSRDAMGIANALYRIKTNGKGSLLDSSHAEDMSHMCFGSALKFKAFSGLLATHPPIDERIKTLVPGYRSIAQQRESAESASASQSNIQSNIQSNSQSTNENIVSSGFSAEQTISGSIVSEDALVITDAKDLINQIGTVGPAQLEQAHKLHEQLPNNLIEASHSEDSARLLIEAIVVAHSEMQQLDWNQVIEDKHNSSDLKTISNLAKEVSSLDTALILPLIEMAIPSLKTASQADKNDLLACASLLITADKNISPFEFFLYALLRKNLSHKDATFSSKTYRKFNPVIKDIEYLISILAAAAYGNHLKQTPESKSVVANAMKSFDHKWQSSGELPLYDAKQLNRSLKRLNQLTPLLKKPLMLTLADIVMKDSVIKIEEIELLRATGIYLECPIPPMNVNIQPN